MEALKAAIAEAKSGSDLKSYRNAVQLLRRYSKGSEADVQEDSVWVEQKGKQNKVESARLEHELKGYKNNLIKESIRVSYSWHSPKPRILIRADIDEPARWAMKTSATITTVLETSIMR